MTCDIGFWNINAVFSRMCIQVTVVAKNTLNRYLSDMESAVKKNSELSESDRKAMRNIVGAARKWLNDNPRGQAEVYRKIEEVKKYVNYYLDDGL